MTLKEKKEEAVARMRLLNLTPKVIKEFSERRKVYLSFGGLLLNLSTSQKEKIHNFETENNCLVYHVIYDHTSFGEMLTLLYVSKYSEEWEQDRADIKEGFPMAYVINLDNDEFSEFGSVGVKTYNDGLIRTE